VWISYRIWREVVGQTVRQTHDSSDCCFNRFKAFGIHFALLFKTFYLLLFRLLTGWLGRRVVSVLDSGAEGPGLKSQSRRCLRQTVHTHCDSVHQAAKLVAALLKVAGVTASLAESNGSLPPGL